MAKQQKTTDSSGTNQPNKDKPSAASSPKRPAEHASPESLNDTQRALYDIFRAAPRETLNVKQIRSRLEEQGLELRDPVLQRELAFLDKTGLLDGESHRYRLRQQGQTVSGRLEIWTRENIGLVHSPELPEPVSIGDPKRIDALGGDIVSVRLRDGGGERLEGEFLDVVSHTKTEFTGRIEHAQHNNYFVPQDRYLRQDFVISNKDLNGAQDGQKVRVRLTGFKNGKPRGEVIEVIGESGTHEVEMHAIIEEFRLSTTFPQAVEAEANQFAEAIPAEEAKRRRDMRAITTFTIDPEDAKDFDDALSVEWLDGGRLRVGVHIADVSYFVQPGTALDTEAYERATSVYLVDRTLPMLPERLSNGLCSLRPNEDRLAYSAIFELDDAGRVHDEWFGRTIIHSDRRFAYEDVQTILDAGEGEFHAELDKLNQLAYKLRDERFARGSVNFEMDEVKFRLDDDGRPLDVYVKERFDAHKLIEDFMLLANRRVATFIANKDKNTPFPYRVHPLPDYEKLKTLSGFVANFGYRLDISSEDPNQLAHQINNLAGQVIGKPEQNIVQSMAVRSMPKAYYSPHNDGHYGLGFPYYTHFTSPIRRYPDLLVHRVLEAVLSGAALIPENELEEMCRHSSEREKVAADAERASIKYKQAEYLGFHVGEEFDGSISGLTDFGMYVMLSENACEGMAFLQDIDEDVYELDESGHFVKGRYSGRVYKMGDRVRIRVRRTNVIRRQVDFTILKKLASVEELAQAHAEGREPTQPEIPPMPDSAPRKPERKGGGNHRTGKGHHKSGGKGGSRHRGGGKGKGR